MHDEVLSSGQRDLLPLMSSFSSGFSLIGGTAVALQLGHRRSIDFDLMTHADLKTNNIRNKIAQDYRIKTVLVDETDEFTIVVENVKLTFLKYPFVIIPNAKLRNVIKMPDLPTLGAMKAYALGRRAKWKDYVDLYFIINKYSFREIVERASLIFDREFNEKLFREQLAYFKDIDYTERIDFMSDCEINDEEIKSKLTEISLQK